MQYEIRSKLGWVFLNSSIAKTYLGDRSVTACAPDQLQTLHTSWKEWSQKVGLIENEAKAVTTAVDKNRLERPTSILPAHMLQSSVAVLGSVRAVVKPMLLKTVVSVMQSLRLALWVATVVSSLCPRLMMVGLL